MFYISVSLYLNFFHDSVVIASPFLPFNVWVQNDRLSTGRGLILVYFLARRSKAIDQFIVRSELITVPSRQSRFLQCFWYATLKNFESIKVSCTHHVHSYCTIYMQIHRKPVAIYGSPLLSLFKESSSNKGFCLSASLFLHFHGETIFHFSLRLVTVLHYSNRECPTLGNRSF